MRPPDRASIVVASMVVVVLMAAGCSRLTFIRQNASPGKYEKTSPDYDFRDDPATVQRGTLNEHLSLANNSLRAGQFDQAQREAEAALKIDAKSADAHTLLAVIEDQRGNSAKAGGYYARAVELAPTQGAALNNYGAWLCGNGRAAESLPLFDRALADPAYRQRASALANAGACALKAGQTARAEAGLREAVSLDPDNPTALAAMARYQYLTAHYMDARAFSERRLAAAPATADVLELASQIEDRLGDSAAAARYVQRLLAEFPQAQTTPAGGNSRP